MPPQKTIHELHYRKKWKQLPRPPRLQPYEPEYGRKSQAADEGGIVIN